MERAAEIAVAEVQKALHDNSVLEKVVFVCFNPCTIRAYEKALAPS